LNPSRSVAVAGCMISLRRSCSGHTLRNGARWPYRRTTPRAGAALDRATATRA